MKKQIFVVILALIGSVALLLLNLNAYRQEMIKTADVTEEVGDIGKDNGTTLPNDDDDDPPLVCDHTYAASWSKSKTHHWYAATCEHADEKKDYAEHTFGDGTQCTVCSYQRLPTEGLVYKLNSPNGESYTVTGIGTATDTSIIIAETYQGLPVIGIGEDAFRDCSDVTDIVIPESVTSIGDSAFRGCSALMSITIPDSVTSIGVDVFYGCSSLAYTIYDDANYLGNADNPYLCLVKASTASITSCIVHPGTKFIYDNAFSMCNKLTSVTIPNGVMSIGNYAFMGCSGLANITIPDSVTSIGNTAFNACGLVSIAIPDGVTSIDERTFYFCTDLKSIIIPNSVTSIGYAAFDSCVVLSTVYYTGTEEEWNLISIVFDNDYLTSATIYYYSETAPTEAGNYWHYVKGVPTVW